jgi:predicted nucleic acid binding AN1-type Zn finger protein
MEFANLGKHCALPSCKQLDFLPFTCTSCNQVTCLEHRTFIAHKCPAHKSHEAIALQCPICERIIPVADGSQSADQVMDAHIAQGCKKPQSVKPLKCAVKGCKTKSAQQSDCKHCGFSFCLGHRFPDDHKCKERRSRHFSSRLVREHTASSSAEAVAPLENSSSGNGILGIVQNAVIASLNSFSFGSNTAAEKSAEHIQVKS